MISYGPLTACFGDIFETRNEIYMTKTAWNHIFAEF